MEITSIEFEYYGEDTLEYLEKEELWQGYLRLNATQQFKYQVKDNTFILLDEYRKNDLFTTSYIKDRDGLYEAALKNKDILHTSEDLLAFIDTLEKVKNVEKLDILSQKVVGSSEQTFIILVTLQAFPLNIRFEWLKLRGGQTVLNPIISPVIQGKKPYTDLQTNNMSHFIGEQKIRTLWKELIKSEKNRLRLSNFSIE